MRLRRLSQRRNKTNGELKIRRYCVFARLQSGLGRRCRRWLLLEIKKDPFMPSLSYPLHYFQSDNTSKNPWRELKSNGQTVTPYL